MSTPAAPAPEKKKKGKLVLILVVLVVLLAGGGGGAFWWMQSKAHAAAAPAKPAAALAQYHALEPAFVVNLADGDTVRYLQADVQLMTRDADTLAALELHAPALRNRLLLLFSQQTSAQLAQRSGKERLQEKALKEVQAVLKSEKGPAKVEAVYFTSLVTQ